MPWSEWLEAPVGAEPAVGKNPWAASWTLLQGETCPLQALHNMANNTNSSSDNINKRQVKSAIYCSQF